MVTLNTLLLVCIIVAPVTAITTAAFFLLLGSYLGVKEIKKEVKKEKVEDEEVFTIPMSSLSSLGGAGGAGGGRPITQADVDRARAAMASYSATQGAGGCTDSGCGGEKEEKPALGGQYI